MTVEELINRLSRYPKGTKLVLAKDGTGARCSPLVAYTVEKCRKPNTFEVEVLDYEEEDAEEAFTAVVLWPMV